MNRINIEKHYVQCKHVMLSYVTFFLLLYVYVCKSKVNMEWKKKSKAYTNITNAIRCFVQEI